MSNKTEHTNNAEPFEDLLKDAFLDLDLDDPKNETIIEALSAGVMIPVGGQQLKSTGSFKRFIYKISLQSVLFIGVAIVSWIIGFKLCERTVVPEKRYMANERKIIADIHPVSSRVDKQLEQMPHEKVIAVQPQPYTQQTAKCIVHTQMPDTSIMISMPEKNIPECVEPVVSNPPIIIKATEEVAFGFPQFTEQDVKANSKQKKKMMDQLMKPSKPNYLLIPNGKLTYKGEIKLIGDFYMQGHEVTNLEYRTFLFDLLFAKKKEEYLKAKPNNASWLNCTGTDKFNGFEKEYFSNKAFDDYPVVNITAEAARMYCIWLDKVMEDREDGTIEFYIDLPKESEWVYSAKGGFTNSSYPWGTDLIQNSSNCFLANFNVQQLQDKFKQPYGYRAQTNLKAYTSAGLASNTDTMATASVLAYNPNAYGLYCMSGNVAEWVLSEDGQTMKAMGGSWGSDFEHLKIGGESEFTGKTSSPFIGFRVLVLIKKNQ